MTQKNGGFWVNSVCTHFLLLITSLYPFSIIDNNYLSMITFFYWGRKFDRWSSTGYFGSNITLLNESLGLAFPVDTPFLTPSDFFLLTVSFSPFVPFLFWFMLTFWILTLLFPLLFVWSSSDFCFFFQKLFGFIRTCGRGIIVRFLFPVSDFMTETWVINYLSIFISSLL